MQTGYAKRAIKREPGYPTGVTAPCFLDCECGYKLSLPVITGLPMTYQCLCGREYDSQGWIIKALSAK